MPKIVVDLIPSSSKTTKNRRARYMSYDGRVLATALSRDDGKDSHELHRLLEDCLVNHLGIPHHEFVSLWESRHVV